MNLGAAQIPLGISEGSLGNINAGWRGFAFRVCTDYVAFRDGSAPFEYLLKLLLTRRRDSQIRFCLCQIALGCFNCRFKLFGFNREKQLAFLHILTNIKVGSLEKTLHPGANLYASRTGGSPRIF
jgi:hypothetical protein